uniref:Uncharacterized protein n=1 Tax=Salinispora arenicola (strain CNS-205) TaxID=391037 RepID=A8M4L8_SALAI
MDPLLAEEPFTWHVGLRCGEHVQVIRWAPSQATSPRAHLECELHRLVLGRW